jgi:ATP-binding cassette subfamily C protein/ATP-binding cassette subfamily C protein LapB
MSTALQETSESQVRWDNAHNANELRPEQVVSGSLGSFKALTDLAACLLPLLKELDWDGDPRHLLEAMPHFADKLDLTDLLNVMANLGYSSRSLSLDLGMMDPRLAPCLFLPNNGPALVVVGRDGDSLNVFDGEQRAYQQIPARPLAGRAYVFENAPDWEREQDAMGRGSYVRHVLGRFRPLILRGLATSLVINLLVLATPLFIMSVYDKVIGTGSYSMLAFLLAGIAIVMLGDLALKAVRARMIAHFGARLDHILGRAVLQRILFLPPAYTELANISAQVARLKDFEVIREFFTGPMATVAFEIPFTLLFLFAMAALAGPLVFVPMIGMALFFAVVLALRPAMRRKVAEASRAGSRKQQFLVESLSKLRDIRDTGAEDVWRDRYRELTAAASLKGYESARLTATAQVVSQSLIVCTGLTTLGWGVHRVLAGDMTVGALIASMTMVWWIMRPLQAGFVAMTQMERVRDSASQIDRLLAVRPERADGERPRPLPRVQGRITFNNASMRYLADADPAVIGLNLQIEPGEVIGVVGPNGSGKSTILKLILGLYRPQAGSVRIDGVDIRQIDPIEMRRSIAYVPQQCEVFFGTIAQNLRLASPAASDEELEWACQEAGVLDDIKELPKGFWTRIGDGKTQAMPSHMMQRLSLARAYLKRAPITLFDEPANGLDFVGDQQFIKVLEKMRGNSTVFLVTHRPSHLKQCDRVIVMQQGQVRMVGPAQKVLEKLPPGVF